jgi:hypothetical protein
MCCLCLTLERDNQSTQVQFRIADLEAVARRLVLENPRLGQVWGCKSVRYEERFMIGVHNPASQPDPFIKSPEFGQEQEFRIVWPESDRVRQPGGTFDLVAFNTAPSRVIARMVERC